ncbi:MAG: hypothetical protein KME16_12105 [Scytolyngbya sp. HA4215-MV1]|jgi:hypothetical protein|nr:hypothetical protein [Scytolyngbya sp. HA4215-MV1]
MELMHPGLKELLSIEQYVPNRKIGFLSIETPLPEFFKKLTQSIPNYSIALNVRREYRHIATALRAFQLKDVDCIFLFEIYLQHVFITLPLLALTGKEILICLHGEQQFAEKNIIKYIGLLYLKLFLKLFKSKIVLFEIDDKILPEKVRIHSKSKIIIPHPIRSDVEPTLPLGSHKPDNEPIKIGIVGMIREDKPIFELAKRLAAYTKQADSGCELIIGLPFYQKTEKIEQLEVQLYDTTQESEYFNLLKKLDILVAFYKGDRYYYRASGVVNDAVSCGCYILASDYPVIQHQLLSPVEVGKTFQTFDELESRISEVIPHIRSHGKDNQWLWREGRTAKTIAKQLFSAELDGKQETLD